MTTALKKTSSIKSSATSLAVLGAGSWGTALSVCLARNQHAPTLWSLEAEQVVAMQKTRRNEVYLPGVELPANLLFEGDLTRVVSTHRDILIVIPSEGFRGLLSHIKSHLRDDVRVIWATKGLEVESGKFLHEVLSDELGDNVPHAVISGPTFAGEVARGKATAMTVASTDTQLADDVIKMFHGQSMRMYKSEDIIGVQLGGAVKNVLAIATGISDGLGFGANARAALVTRGLAEIMRLGKVLGAHQETLMGLAGLGDLVLTCTDDQSRNRRYGLARGKGQSHDEALASIGQVVEGTFTARVVMQVAQRAGVEMPICAEVYRVLFEGTSPKEAGIHLLSRSPKSEF